MTDELLASLLDVRQRPRPIPPPSETRRLSLHEVSLLPRPKAGDTVRASYTRLGSVSARFS